jgi:hypothetical protein
MKTSFYLAAFAFAGVLISCSKSSSDSNSSNNGNGGNTGYNNGTGLYPLAVGSVWNYKLKDYNPATGATLDSTNFSLRVIGKTTANGITYFQLQNSLDNSITWLTNINSSTIGSIDSVNGVHYYTAFVSGSGDSTQSVSTWPANAGSSCVGTEDLYAHYADTTLADFEGNVYTNSIKNDAVIFNCSSNKYEAQIYFVKQGIGMVRYAQYTYTAGGTRELVAAWLLQSYTLAN